MIKRFSLDTLLTVLVVALLLYVVWRRWNLQPDLINGTVAPDFTTLLVSGDTLKWSQLKGKYVLLDFWASWCAPCRKESDELVALYKKYHHVQFKDASGFEIVSIGLETERQKWLSAIEEDSLIWQYHSSELKGFDAVPAQLYDVKAIPTKFLINSQGIIVGVNRNIGGVERFLAKRMTN